MSEQEEVVVVDRDQYERMADAIELALDYPLPAHVYEALMKAIGRWKPRSAK